MNHFFKIILISLFVILCSCQSSTKENKKEETLLSNNSNSNTIKTIKNSVVSDSTLPPHSKTIAPDKPVETPKNQPSLLQERSTNSTYPWLDKYNPNDALKNQISPPTNYQRIPTRSNSFGAWLRGLPLLSVNTKVLFYNGVEKPYQDGAYRVINIDIGKRDLQQCADAVMRLKAEYHYSQQDYNAIHFNYTSGHTIHFSDWSKGKKPRVKGNKVTFSPSSSTHNTSYSNFKKYLNNVYCFAGTASLAKELQSKKIADISLGDVFIWGGFPGHAVLVVDVARHSITGKKIFLLAQSYMPAQSIHILKNLNDAELSPWYSEDFGPTLHTPEWTFERNTLKAF